MQVSAITNDVLGELDAVSIGRGISAGDFTAQEAVSAAIARLQSVDPVLHGMVCERFELALAEAAGLPASGSGAPFAGVPSLIKDNTDVAGLPTRQGSAGTSPEPMAEDGDFTRTFRATGLIPIGKSSLPEFGLTATTEPLSRPATRNPWNPA